ncbi:MAG: hypothetical protein A3F40_03680 [Chlamydiae bacterium RIFCSPHIGHO2_12_FULL_27_8]|nr:MAG: hypothetical protein A3F40_03680 [Chlamydiae bacterium RIFCSPHIGHO2_12_FULL_27_8]
MGRFFTLFAVILVFCGLLLHYKVDIPIIFAWIGQMPGDVIVNKGRSVIYLPITTAASTSLLITILTSP